MTGRDIEVTTAKLVDLAPTWAPIRGWSILFDDPGSPPTGGRLQRLTVVREPSGLYDSLAELAPVLVTGEGARGVAWLPPSVFHVTVADGLSNVRIGRSRRRRSRRAWERLIEALPASVDEIRRTLDRSSVAWRGLLEAARNPVTFAFDGAEVRGDAIVACLRPLTTSDAVSLRSISRARAEALDALSRDLRADLTTPWRPHVTLGYVANRDIGSSLVDRVSTAGRSHISKVGATITFRSASLYVFTSMVEFWRQ